MGTLTSRVRYSSEYIEDCNAIGLSIENIQLDQQ